MPITRRTIFKAISAVAVLPIATRLSESDAQASGIHGVVFENTMGNEWVYEGTYSPFGTGVFFDTPPHMAVDGLGNIYVVGDAWFQPEAGVPYISDQNVIVPLLGGGSASLRLKTEWRPLVDFKHPQFDAQPDWES